MGGGNAQKSATARAKKQAKEASAGKKHSTEDVKKQVAANNVVQCNICLIGFPRTVKQVELQQHLDNKHAKAGKTVAEVYPAFTPTA